MVLGLLKGGIDFINEYYDRFSLHFPQIFYAGYILNFFYLFGFLLSIQKSDITYVDALWGLAYAVQAFVYYTKSMKHSFIPFFSEQMSWEKLLFACIVGFHGLRLCFYVLLRHNKEDKRYVRWRERIGKNFWWISYPLIFLPQMITSIISGLTIYEFCNARKKDINHFFYYMGISTMLLGMAIEILSDIQMYMFQLNKKNKERVLDTGFWAMCRHPNYFGHSLFHWGMFICNIAVGHFWTIISPITFMFAMCFITGIPGVEAVLLREKGERYREYMHNVPSFLPLGYIRRLFMPKEEQHPEQQKEMRETGKQTNIPTVPIAPQMEQSQRPMFKDRGMGETSQDQNLHQRIVQ